MDAAAAARINSSKAVAGVFNRCQDSTKNCQTDTSKPDAKLYKYPGLVARAQEAAESATRAADAAKQMAANIERQLNSSGSDADRDKVDTARQLAEEAQAAAAQAAHHARLLTELCCYDQQRASAAVRQPQRTSAGGQPPLPQVVAGQVAHQHGLIHAYRQLLLNVLEDPAQLQQQASVGYKSMQALGMPAEWAWLQQKYRPSARMRRLLLNLMHKQKGEFQFARASLPELLRHAFSNLRWLLWPCDAEQEAAETLRQDLLADEHRPQPAGLAAATAKAEALRQLCISFKMQTILAAPAQFYNAKARAADMRWFVLAGVRAELHAWQKRHKQLAKEAAEAAAKLARDSAKKSTAATASATAAAKGGATASAKGLGKAADAARNVLDRLKARAGSPPAGRSPSPTPSTRVSPRQPTDTADKALMTLRATNRGPTGGSPVAEITAGVPDSTKCPAPLRQSPPAAAAKVAVASSGALPHTVHFSLNVLGSSTAGGGTGGPQAEHSSSTALRAVSPSGGGFTARSSPSASRLGCASLQVFASDLDLQQPASQQCCSAVAGASSAWAGSTEPQAGASPEAPPDGNRSQSCVVSLPSTAARAQSPPDPPGPRALSMHHGHGLQRTIWQLRCEGSISSRLGRRT